jgi:alanine racemase
MRITQPATAASATPPTEAGVLSVDLAALVANWRLLAARAAPGECGAVVKADGYGLGLEPVMRALLGAGCRCFFVATVAEGLRARAISAEATIYVLEGLAIGGGPSLIAARLRPALAALEEIDEWAALGRAAGRPLEAGLHLDTGMNRTGVPARFALEAAARAQDVRLTLVMSHLVSSQWPQAEVNARQIALFSEARRYFPGAPASLANSSGLFLPQAPALDLARPGYALYGGNPTPDAPNPMRPVAYLSARILSVREISAGESVGYDSGFTAKRAMRLATLGVGYADGVPVCASGRAGAPGAEALVGGLRCPFVGRVSMDFVVIDVTDAPPRAAQRGDYAELLGETIGVDEFAARAGTIGYEILTRLGARYARRYSGA